MPTPCTVCAPQVTVGEKLVRWAAARSAWVPLQSTSAGHEIRCEQLQRLGDGRCSEASLAAATSTLRQVDLVGITDHMPETLRLAEHVLGLSPAGPHMAHCHTVHLPLGALLTPCSMRGTGTSPLPLPHLSHRSES